MPKCVIRQSAGLGDIMFCQKIGKTFIKRGYEVIWPVIPHYYNIINKYMPSNIKYCSSEEDYPYKDLVSNNITQITNIGDDIFIPLEKCTCGWDFMRDKYKFVDINYTDWQDYFEFTRDLNREKTLEKFLELDRYPEYIFVNGQFATPPDTEIRLITPNTHKMIIEMTYLGFDNVFDWCGVIENADEIHTVDTVICYIIEKLVTKGDLNIYTRNNPQRGFKYQGAFLKPWVYHL